LNSGFPPRRGWPIRFGEGIKESEFGILIDMEEETKLILKSLIELAANTQSDLSATYMLIADHLPNLDETQRKRLRDESELRLENSRQLKLNAQNL
jgi:hypothetical protein